MFIKLKHLFAVAVAHVAKAVANACYSANMAASSALNRALDARDHAAIARANNIREQSTRLLKLRIGTAEMLRDEYIAMKQDAHWFDVEQRKRADALSGPAITSLYQRSAQKVPVSTDDKNDG